jgi:proline iminopeptidase
VEASIETNRSLAEHFERGTLRERLPSATLPVLFVHGEESALPVRGSRDTAALIPDAELVVVPGVGHFPWIERPGSVKDAVAPFLAR